MVFRDIQCLEIVVRRFDLRAFYHAKAERKKDALDFLESLLDEVPRTNRPNHPRQGEINALASKRRALRRGDNCRMQLLKPLLDMAAQIIKAPPYCRAQPWRGCF